MDVEVTQNASDGGIDVRGTLVVGGVVHVRMAIQAKRWKDNVGAPIVQQVRGSLSTYEQGLIITTSDYTAAARKEAERRNTSPVALMNGKQFAALLTDHQIGVTHEPHTLYTLAELDE